jgi:serine/threonine protein kinase
MKQGATYTFYSSNLGVEIKRGPLLGAGEFGVVYQVDSFQQQKAGCGCQTTCGNRGSSPPEEEAPGDQTNTSKGKKQTERGEGYSDSDYVPVEVTNLPSRNSIGVVVDSKGHQSADEIEDDISDLDENDDEDGEVVYLRDYLIHHVYRCGQFRYAIKRLRMDLDQDQDKLMAAIDMAREAKLMSAFSHPNIVRMRAIMGVPGTQYDNFGIIVDRLNETLREKIGQWTKSERDASGNLLQKMRRQRSAQWDTLFLERLWAVYDIARAMRYLHSQK